MLVSAYWALQILKKLATAISYGPETALLSFISPWQKSNVQQAAIFDYAKHGFYQSTYPSFVQACIAEML